MAVSEAEVDAAGETDGRDMGVVLCGIEEVSEAGDGLTGAGKLAIEPVVIGLT